MVMGWDVDDAQAPQLWQSSPLFSMDTSLGWVFSSGVALQIGVYKGLLTRMERRRGGPADRNEMEAAGQISPRWGLLEGGQQR